MWYPDRWHVSHVSRNLGSKPPAQANEPNAATENNNGRCPNVSLRRLKTKVFSAGNAADALAASMAVPILFKPVWANGRPLIDGAVGDVAGVDGLDRSERVLYHHVSFAGPSVYLSG